MADNKETVDAEKESENYVDKKRHSCLDALKFFPRHNTLLFWSIFMLFLSIVIGTFAILITLTIQVGKEAFYAMTTDPLGQIILCMKKTLPITYFLLMLYSTPLW